MNKIYVFSDVTCDLPKQLIRENMEILDFSLTIGNEVFDHTTEPIDRADFYKRMKNGEKVNTAMLNQYYFTERMNEVLAKGFDVIYLCFSSALSGSFGMAEKTASEIAPSFPKQKVRVINSLNASIGEGLLLEYLLRKRESGATFDQLVDYTNSLIDHVCSYFTVNDLAHLASLGRVSKTQAFIGTVAKIMPLLFVNKLGELVPIEKLISRKKALKGLVDKMEEKMLPASEQQVVFIGHGESREDAEIVKQMITERFGITNIIIDYIGTVIGCHSGYGTIALFFLGKDKLEQKDAHTAAMIK